MFLYHFKFLNLFILPIFLISIKLFSQRSLVVDLVDHGGTGPFRVTSLSIDPIKQEPTDYIRPTNLRYSFIRSFDLQRAQSYLWNYHSGKISKDRFYSYVKEHNVDTTLLTNKVFSNKLWILIGVDSSGATVVIPDMDDNHSFTNETPLIFKKIADKKESLEARKHPLAQQIEYKYFNGKEIERRKVVMKFNTYLGNLVVKNGTEDSLGNSLFLEVGLDGYKEGFFKTENISCKVALSSGFIDGGYTRGNTGFIFSVAQKDFLTENEGYIPYNLGDIVSVEGNLFRIDSLNISSTKLFLTYLGLRVRPEGHMAGSYLPPFQGTTIENKRIDFRNYRGKYLLLDFWGTWCAPCIEAIPHLKSIKEKFEEKDFEIIGVAFDKDSLKVQKFVFNKNINWTQIFQEMGAPGRNDSLIRLLKISHYPTTFLIDKEGKILLRDKTPADIEKILDKVLN